MDHAAWLERVDSARQELGWSGRELARRAGLNEGQYGVTSNRIRNKEGAQPSAKVVDALTGVLVGVGFAETWLRTGEGTPRAATGARAASTRSIEIEPRYADAPQAIQALIEDGYDPRAVRRAVGDVAFDEGAEGSGALDLYRAAKKILDLERGRVEVGVKKVESGEF